MIAAVQSRARLTVTVLTVLAMVSAVLVGTVGSSTAETGCGVERQPVKVGSDADAGKVNLGVSSLTTIAGLSSLVAPQSLPNDHRVAPVEDTVFTERDTLTQYKLEDDGDYHLVLSDPAGHTMITEIPDPSCVPTSSPFRASIVTARQAFDQAFTATTSFQTTNTPVQVRGVGFFDFQHGQTGVAPNAIELHPVLAFTANAPAPTVVTRLSGPDRYGTAAAISRANFPAGVPVAYIATGASFPDALAGGAAAATQDGPVLLVSQNSIPGPIKAELGRLRPGRIVLLGGTAAVSQQVQTQLSAYTSGGVTRLSGSSRYGTAAAVAQAVFGSASTVLVATGQAFPDALSGTAAAGSAHDPILLVQQNAIPAETARQLQRLHPDKIVILGGPGAVSTSVQTQLGRYAASVGRLSGNDRYATSARIAAAAFPTADTALLAAGTGFPDALAGGPVAGLAYGPLLLTTTGCVPQVIADQLGRLIPAQIDVLGGTGVVASTAANLAPCAPTAYPTASPTPTTPPTPTASATPSTSPSASASPSPTPTATPTPTTTPTPSTSPSASASPSPTSTAGQLACTASVSEANPPQNSTEHVLVQTTAGAGVTATAHYKTSDTTHTGTADSNGSADIPFDISRASSGYTVQVDVTVTLDSHNAACSTSFTPQ